MKLTGKYSLVMQLVGWIMYFIIPFFTMPNFISFQQQDFLFFLTHLIINNVLLIGIFYINYSVLVNRFLLRNKTKQYLLILFLLLIILLIFSYLSDLLLFKNPPSKPPFVKPEFNIGPPPPRPEFYIDPKYFGTFFSYFLIVVFSSLVALLTDRIKVNEEKKQIQFEKTAAELSALKLQISPHFLFNTLNNIRWLARKKSDLTEDAIVKLATLLRYIIYQANEQKVALVLEINNLKDFIGLQEMRIGNNTIVSFEVSGLVEDYEIEPLLFIPFVENAFKYGVSDTVDSEIKIDFKLVAHVLNFKVSNSIFRHQCFDNLENTGLGIENVRQRLCLLYPYAHTLNISENDDKFTVNLRLELNNG